MKKIITILLACLMLLTTVSAMACAGPKQPDTPSGTVDALEHLKGLNFEGQELVFVFAEGVNGFTSRSIDVDEESADSVDKKIYERNTAVEKMLNVDITSLQAADSITGLQGAINSALSAQSEEYDVIAGYQYYDIGLATKGYLIDLNTLGTGDYADAGHLRLDADYWATNYNNSISYNGVSYWITGDLALRYLGGMYCTYVNETIYKEKLEKDFGDIYEIARRGEWTLDKLNEMAAMCYEDLGAEGTDEEDKLGYAWEPNDPIDGLAYASNIKFAQAYSDGSMRITINNAQTITFIEKLEKLLTSEYSCKVADGDSATVMTLFSGGTLAFTVNKIFQAETYLRDMEDNYYIIPAPKLNADQENYVTGIPVDAPNVAASAATLEAMAAESLRIVTPEYYDSSLKFKYTRDDTAAEMIDLIRASVDTNFAAAWSASCNNIVHFFRTSYTSKNASSSLRKLQSTSEKSLEKLIESFNELKQTA